MGESMDWDEADPNIQDSVIHEDSETGEHWLTYFEGSTEGKFEDWLEMHKPSLIYKKRFEDVLFGLNNIYIFCAVERGQ